MRTIILALLLVGCDQAPPDSRTVTLVFVKTEAELRAKCGNDLVIEPLGCQKPPCKIIAYEPRGFDDHRRIETLGHELWHCYRGPKHV